LRLFHFRTWILFPDTQDDDHARWAELLAAVKFLDRIEENDFADEDAARQAALGDERVVVDLNDKPPQTLSRIELLRSRNRTYRRIYDGLVGRRGGLYALLEAPSPAAFDDDVRQRTDRMHIISNLIDYRLRYVQHGNLKDKATGANLSHALFFCYWPTHSVVGKRGKTSPNKSVSVKTMRTWWKRMEDSAICIYLIHKLSFKQSPGDVNDGFFKDRLVRSSADKAELTHFFGAYAYIAKTFSDAGCDVPLIDVPRSIKHVKVKTDPFTKAEWDTIAQYKENYGAMIDESPDE
jgi:hypothetical protein